MTSIRERRERLGWTQDKASRLFGVTVRTWQRWEDKPPRLGVMFEICFAHFERQTREAPTIIPTPTAALPADWYDSTEPVNDAIPSLGAVPAHLADRVQPEGEGYELPDFLKRSKD